MLNILKNNKEGTSWKLFNRSNINANPSRILKKLAKSFDKELKLRLRQIDSSVENLPTTEAIHLATENLVNTKLSVEKTLLRGELLTGEAALVLFEKQIEQTKAILESETISRSKEASEIAGRTLNLLFCARQAVKQQFSVITPLVLPEIKNGNTPTESEMEPRLLSSAINDIDRTPRMIINSTLLFQLHHSLFPAERMLVGAGQKTGKTIEIDGIFDVTGNASSGYVKADADRLARALIAMSETGKYFAFWIHSHPGKGAGATYPSGTDTKQEAEWLKDYSPNLVNAIVVEDRYIRFWGKALDANRVKIEIIGTGIRRVSESEEIYQLEF
jgi:proteasome lid subunit RPN8/RPN11